MLGLELVGDASLITADNVRLAGQEDIVLLGRLPRTVKACDETVQMALEKPDDWTTFQTPRVEQKPASYQGQHFQREVFGQAVQLGVIRHLNPNPRVEKAVRNRARRALDEAVNAIDAVQKKEFHCEADAREVMVALEQRLSKRMIQMQWAVETRLVEMKHGRRGRPRAGEKRPIQEQVVVLASLEINESEVKRHIALDSCFVLIYTGKTDLGVEDMLSRYKRQAVVETKFPFLKDARLADRFFVKKPGRLEALGYVMLIALLLWCVWQRRVRLNLEASKEKPLKDVTGMLKRHPTSMVCAHIMRNLQVIRLRNGGEVGPWCMARALDEEQQRVVRFSEVRPKVNACLDGSPAMALT